MGNKIKRLLGSQPHGVVLLSSWLTNQGYSYDLQQRYKKGNWLHSIGTGALIRANDKVSYEGAICALQQQANMSIHPGGKTALSFLGKAHYLELGPSRVFLFSGYRERPPAWFTKYDWGVKLQVHKSTFLPKDLCLVEIDIQHFSIKVSGAPRAMMECLYLAHKNQDLIECAELMEGLNNLQPRQVQVLLENCRSVKVKRLFLYLAEKSNHPWLAYLDTAKIDLGTGKRSLVKNGTFVEKYGITVPREMESHGKNI